MLENKISIYLIIINSDTIGMILIGPILFINFDSKTINWITQTLSLISSGIGIIIILLYHYYYYL